MTAEPEEISVSASYAGFERGLEVEQLQGRIDAALSGVLSRERELDGSDREAPESEYVWLNRLAAILRGEKP